MTATHSDQRSHHTDSEAENDEEKHPLVGRADCSSPRQHELANQHDEDDEDDATASWKTMPKKRQLAILTFGRFCQSVISSSRQSYILFQLRSFKLPDGSVPDAATLAFQVSILSVSLAVPRLFMSTVWGILADSPSVGRKRVMLFGLLIISIASLGLGFTSSFPAVVVCRIISGLASNGKGVSRTMIKDISGKKFESRAVLLLPTAFNIGSVVGPVVGGLLADPVATYPSAFGPGSSLGAWLQRWPYALPNIFNSIVSILCAVLMAFQLEETHQGGGRRSATIIPGWARTLFKRRFQTAYKRIPNDENGQFEMDDRGENASSKAEITAQPVSIWTRRLITTLIANGLMVMHVGIYPSLLMIFISTPRYSPGGDSSEITSRGLHVNTTTANGALSVPPNYHPHAPFTFTGGLSFKPNNIATALAIRGVVGVLLQLLFFPYLKRVFGVVKLYRYALLIFPATYFVTPYWATVPSTTLPPLPAAGIGLWIFITVILAIQSTARSLVLPSSSMLINAATPNRSSLATVNGMDQSVAAGARIVGPLLIGWMYGVGLRHGVVGAAWWVLAAVSVSAAVAGACLKPEKRTDLKSKSSIQAEP